MEKIIENLKQKCFPVRKDFILIKSRQTKIFLKEYDQYYFLINLRNHNKRYIRIWKSKSNLDSNENLYLS